MHEWFKLPIWQGIILAYHLEQPVQRTATVYELTPEAFCHTSSLTALIETNEFLDSDFLCISL